jgi:hypothetical protein
MVNLEIDIKSRIISFWAKLLSGKELKLSKIIDKYTSMPK